MFAKIFCAKIIFLLDRHKTLCIVVRRLDRTRNSAIFRNRGTHVKTKPHLRAVSREEDAGCEYRVTA